MIEKQLLDELKAKLLEEKKELEENLGKIAKPVDKEKGDYETSFEDIGSDKDDNATEVEQYSQNISIETNLEKQLQSVIESLEKIENGTYGICKNCQGEVSIERLRVNPSAKTCMNCQS